MYSQYQMQFEVPIHVRLGAYGGYNFSENEPNAGAFVSVSGYNMMAEIDVGYFNLDAPGEGFLSLNPSIGFYVGEDFRFYGLIGISNWGEFDMRENRFKSDKIYCKLKAGVDIPLGSKVFVNINWNYIIQNHDPHRHPDDFMQFAHNGLAIGLGYCF